MVDEKTHPNYLSLLSYVIYYIIRAFGTHNVIYFVVEQGHVIWIRFFIHHTNKPLPFHYGQTMVEGNIHYLPSWWTMVEGNGNYLY